MDGRSLLDRSRLPAGGSHVLSKMLLNGGDGEEITTAGRE
jgi:hypothetical protein